MVDPIGLKPVLTGDRKVAAVTRVASSAVAAGAASQDRVESVTVAVAQALAATPPVDVDRVARIRKAITDGNFPIFPAAIADRLIALKLEWNPSDSQ